jgi:hypothetical protein
LRWTELEQKNLSAAFLGYNRQRSYDRYRETPNVLTNWDQIANQHQVDDTK